MKKKCIILLATIIGLMIIGYTCVRVYQHYNSTHKQETSKKETPPSTADNSKPPVTEPPKENTPTPHDNAEVKVTVYQKGDKGDSIIDIQKRLVKYGYELDIDGIFGNYTFNAIWDFQKRLGLSPDGIVGPETLAKLNEEPTEKTMYHPPANLVFKNNITKSNLEKFINENNFDSSTNYFIWVDLANQRVNLFTGSYKKWNLYKSMPCSTGKASTPTVTGNFSIQDKGSYFRVNSNVICKYYTRFYRGYLFHTVLLDNDGNIVDGTLGTPVSHGCIRLAIEDAKYIYDNVPSGTFVWIK